MSAERRLRLIHGGRRNERPAQRREHLRLTSAADRREHRVREGSYAQAMSVGSGECIALCGHSVIMCALATPPGKPCERCAEVDASDSR